MLLQSPYLPSFCCPTSCYFQRINRTAARPVRCNQQGLVSNNYAATLGTRVQRRRRGASACKAARSQEAYVSLLTEAEEAEDWIKTLELLSEVGVLEIQLPPDAKEVAVRTLARGGQARRSADLLSKMLEADGQPAAETILAVLQAWAVAKEAGEAKALLQVLEQRQPSGTTDAAALGRARNSVVRVLAASGHAVEAAEQIDAYLKLQGQDLPTLLQYDTYNLVVNKLMKLGEGARADELLESRDYLQE